MSDRHTNTSGAKYAPVFGKDKDLQIKDVLDIICLTHEAS